MKGIILSAVLFFAVAAWSAPVTVVLQEGVDSYVGTEDAYILSTSGSTNYGTSADLIAKCDKYQSG